MAEPTQSRAGARKPGGLKRWLMVQPIMTRVLIACVPVVLAGVYLFGWRTLALLLSCSGVGLLCEGAFTWPKGKPASSAVFVSTTLYTLVLPPTMPFWMAWVGIAFGIVFAKMAFGGFGANIFNPALAARCFVYICFPIAMTARWADPATVQGGAAGLARWGVDAVTVATPLDAYKLGQSVSTGALFLGNVQGCIGETSALLVLLGAIYLVAKRTASWQIMVSCLLGCAITGAILHAIDPAEVAGPLFQLLAGGMMFGAVFMATDPVSAARTPQGKWIYGVGVGALTVVLRGYSNFSCGLMFAILMLNAFNPTIDAAVTAWQERRADRAKASASGPGG